MSICPVHVPVHVFDVCESLFLCVLSICLSGCCVSLAQLVPGPGSHLLPDLGELGHSATYHLILSYLSISVPFSPSPLSCRNLIAAYTVQLITQALTCSLTYLVDSHLLKHWVHVSTNSSFLWHAPLFIQNQTPGRTTSTWFHITW